jgi:predicted DNA-binding transcriptional regulator YafY
MDILKHGAAVEVIAPESLRRTIERNILEMQEIYIAGKTGKK